MKMNKLLIIGTMVLCSEQVFATCTPNSTFRSLDVSMSMGRIVVRPSDPIGKVLKTGTFPINSTGGTSSYECDSGGGTLKAELSKNPTASNAGTKVYETNIPGIGIRLYRKAENAAADASNYYPYQIPMSRGRYTLASGQFNVEIIKTATKTGSGAVSPGRYSSYYNSTTPGTPWLTSTIYGNSITIASSSCEIQGDIDKIVTLPTVNKSSFSGVGSTQGDQSFDINILCNGGENPSGYEEKNDISLNFDYQQDGNNNVMSNILTPSNSGATGVGVQLISKYNNQTQIIKKGDNLALGTVVSNQNVQYNIPLSARYYQTAANISPGKVKAQATLNIQYQ